MRAIHQFLAGVSGRDAITNEALALRRIFQGWGCGSEIYSEARRIPPELRGLARDVDEYAARRDAGDVALLHLSIGSRVNDLFSRLPCRKALLYHNITPAVYFDLVNRETANFLARGREQMRALANAAEVNMADSRFNAAELEQAGYSGVKVFPLVIQAWETGGAADRRTLRLFDDGLTNVLFVGRCAPNKKIEDLLAAFYFFQKCVEPKSRLIHVGSFAGTERYYHMLLVQARGLEIHHKVFFRGCVTEEELRAHYRCASVFLSMSEHEGYCAPLIEAMMHDVPVMGFAAGAVPETMDGSGVLFAEKRFDLISEMMGQLVHDRAFRSAVIRGQRERVARYARRNAAEEIRRHLAPLLE